MGNLRHLKRGLAKALNIYRWSNRRLVPDVTAKGMAAAREAARRKGEKRGSNGQTPSN